MPSRRKQTTTKNWTVLRMIKIWGPPAGVIIAALWAVYNFYFKEIWVPQSAPVNITVDLQLKKLGASATKGKNDEKRLLAVELKVTASNPSSREIVLLPSAWVAYGYKVVPINKRPNFNDQANAYLSYSQIRRDKFLVRHAFVPPSSVVAVGSLFSDEYLRPHETVTRTLIFHVPPTEYDMLDTIVSIPSATRRSEATLEWMLEEDHLVAYRIDADGKRERIEYDEDGIARDSILGVDFYGSKTQLSLWK